MLKQLPRGGFEDIPEDIAKAPRIKFLRENRGHPAGPSLAASEYDEDVFIQTALLNPSYSAGENRSR